jgi:hypothetical protein
VIRRELIQLMNREEAIIDLHLACVIALDLNEIIDLTNVIAETL